MISHVSAPSLDEAFACAPFIPGGAAYPAQWARRAAAFRAGRPPEELRYGPSERQVVDLWQPQGQAQGTLIFVHGGYWHRFHRSDWSHLAAGALARGWAVAMPGYDLAPAVTLPEITLQVARAIDTVAAVQSGPLRLTGHSAGGQLVCRMLDPELDPPWRARVAQVVPISPVTDLVPLIQTGMNATLRLDKTTAEGESPIRQDAPDTPVHIWVGADERPVFLEQADLLSRAWNCPRTVEIGRHHFDVIEGLEEANSPLTSKVLG